MSPSRVPSSGHLSPPLDRRILAAAAAALLGASGFLAPPAHAAPSAAAVAAATAAESRESQAVEQLTRIEQIMWSRDEKAIPMLRKWAVSDENEQVRERSVGTLVLLGDKADGNIFQDRLTSDRSPRVRRAAAEGIGILKLRIPYTLLVSTLQKDSDPMVRAEAARAIGLTGMNLAGPALLGAVAQDSSPEARALSAEAYARLKLSQGTDLLQGVALRETSLLVRLNVLRALVATAPLESQAVFKTIWETAREPEIRVEALRGLLLSGRGNWDVEGMASADDRVRFLALKEWLLKHYPKRTAFHPPRNAPEVTRLEPFLQDPVRGIRDIARETLERAGFKTRSSGFGYQLAD
jgi:HEAT repeat protein